MADTPLAKLKRTRTSLKGQCKRINTRMIGESALTAEIDPRSIDGYLESAASAVINLTDVHESLVSLDPEKEDEYDEDLAKSLESLEALQGKLRIRSKLGHACVQLERLSEGVRDIIINEDCESSAVHRTMDKYTADFEAIIDFHRGVIRKDDHLAGMKCGIASRLADLRVKLPAVATTPSISVMRPGDEHRSSHPTRTAYHRRLPMIETPKFNGDYLTWDAFHTAYKRNVHDNPDLTDDERLSYLQQSIRDGAQHNLVDELAGSYQECYASLKARYHRPRKLHQHFATVFVTCVPCKDDSRMELTRAHTTLSQAWKKLINTKKVTGDQLLEALAEKILPQSLLRKWAELHPDTSDIPPLAELLEFFEFQARLAPDMPSQDPYNKRPREKAPAKVKAEPARSSPYAKQERNLCAVKHTSHPCLLCKDTDHSLYGCSKFATMSVDQRSEFVQTNRLCYNCLGKGHDKQSCKSSYKCRTCSRKHHSLLHRDQSTAAASNGNTTVERQHADTHQVVNHISQDKLDTVTIVPTMSVSVLSPWGRKADITAMFDTGASISVITNKVVTRLGLKRKRCNTRIVTALGDATTSNTSTVQISVQSTHVPGETLQLTAVVVPIIGLAGTGCKLEPQWKMLDELTLADPTFMIDKTVDLILGQNVSGHIYLDRKHRNPDRSLSAQETIWGWTVEGRVGRPQRLLTRETTATRTLDKSTVASVTICRLQEDAATDDLLKRFFEDEEQIDELPQSLEDQEVLAHFESTHQILPDGRFQVALPRRKDCVTLGLSRGRAMQRYLHNESSLTRRKALQPFQTVMREYFDLGHAEIIQPSEVTAFEQYYMPMHMVVKATSTSTKLRVVFDASAATSNGKSLNDILLTGPTVYPPLAEILIRFRTHRIGITSDISKMYREVALHPDDRDLHRFLWRETPTDTIKDCRMVRVTFGVASSPFMATQVLQKIATLHKEDHPMAALALQRDFYVDDCISGANSQPEALLIQQQLCEVLDSHQMKLRKWRSSSGEVLKGIPNELHEKETTTEPYGHRHYLKTLGVQWNATEDMFHVAISELTLPKVITKRALTSDIAKTFDVLGWFSPAIFTMKSMIQKLWAAKSGWDEPVPSPIQEEWSQWREELPTLSRQPIPRSYFSHTQGSRKSVTLHGFSDASLKGYAAVVYVRATYTLGPPSVMLVQAKTKVAPLKGLTVPRLELCGAQLLAQLITQVMATLSISGDSIWCWTDSAIVLHWLDGKTRPHQTYVANRVRQTLADVPSGSWKHVPGTDNPADCASRGINPRALQAHGLWWHGPAWLSQEPVAEPPQPHLAHLESSSEELIKGRTVSVITGVEEIFEQRYSTYTQLMHTVAWIYRFKRHTKLNQDKRSRQRHLSMADIQTAEIVLYRRAQKRMMAGPNVEKWVNTKTIRSLNPTLDRHGIYRVNGRLHNSSLRYAQRHPIILEGKDVLTKMIIQHLHLRNGHAGPTLLLSAVGRNHYVIRGLLTVKAICHRCVTCRRFNLTTEAQMMGQLPKARVTPSRPFSNVGTDFAGPFTLKKGHTRRPVMIKAYVCAFVCLATKAIHLKMVSDLTTEAFMSCLTRFVGRRGLPSNIHSDNGTNYVGASRELEAIYSLMRQEETQQTVTRYCVDAHINWHFSPARAPHFGGIWEAAIKSFKSHFRRMTNKLTFTFEGMSTILTSIEAALNSRPLMPLHSHSEEGVETLTPGHFLIGQPLTALPEEHLPETRSLKSAFLKGQQLCQQFWLRWSAEYLQQLQKRAKWQKPRENVAVGDIALIRGETAFAINDWPMARVTKVYYGQDGLVRAVDLQNGQRKFTRPIAKLTILVSPTNDTDILTDDPDDGESGTGTLGMPLPPAGMFESETQQEESE